MTERATDGRAAAALADARRAGRHVLSATAGFSLVVNLLVLALPIYSLQVFDRVLSSRSVETLVALTALTLGLVALQAALDHVRGALLRRGALRLEATLTGPALRASLAEATRGDPQAGGGLRDLREVRNVVASPSFTALFDLPMTPVFVVVVFLIHPALGLFVVAAAGLLAALTAVHALASRRPRDEDAKATLRAGEAAQDYVRHAEAVVGLGMTDAVARRWRGQTARLLALEAGLAARAGGVLATTRFVRMAVQVGVTGLGAWLALGGAITPGAMIASSLLMARALTPVEQAVGGWKSWSAGLDAFRRLRATLGAVEDAPAGLPLPAPTGRLEATNLVYRPERGDAAVLRGVSIGVEAGRALAVVGQSGAGKSTLVRLLAGVVRPTSGEIRLDGADYGQWGRSLGRHVGYLPQTVQILSGTVAENVSRFAPHPSPEAIVAAARAAGVHELVLRLPKGYDTPIGAGGHPLSGGQQQRIGLARALYGDPRLVILDEPNSNLDPEGEAALVEALGRCREAGRTVVVVSHRAALLRFVDFIVVLRDGRVERAGPRGEIMRAFAAPGDAPETGSAPQARAAS